MGDPRSIVDTDFVVPPDGQSVMPDRAKHLVVVVAIAVVAVTGSMYVRHVAQERAEARREVVELMRALEAAVTPGDVSRAFDTGKYRLLTLERNNSQKWLVTTPYEFGARNWYLYLDFERDALVGIRVRTEDGANIRAPEAPGDVIRKGS
jgi:hypothetical protein